MPRTIKVRALLFRLRELFHLGEGRADMGGDSFSYSIVDGRKGMRRGFGPFGENENLRCQII